MNSTTKSLKPWVQPLRVSPTEFQAWSKDSNKSESLTFWCLENGKIAPEDYFSWAKEHYGLPLLSTEFFSHAKPNAELWNHIQSVANWSAEMLPLTQWDGVVFIACVEPKDDIQWSFPVSYVLAKPEDLKFYWQSLMTSQEKSFAGIPPTPDKQTSITQIPAEQPAGMNLEKISNVKAAPGVDYMDELAKKITPISKVDQLAPDNLTWSADDISTDSISAPDGFKLQFNSPPEPVVIQPVKETQPVSAVPLHVAAVAPAEVFTAPPKAENPYVKFIPILKSQFVGGMILEVNNNFAQPVCWDENFKTDTPESEKPISLSTASLFRVATRTKQPYLGHVVETEVNQTFFKNWGFSKNPETVLVQPILINNMVTHLIVCLCDNLKKTHQNLRAGDKLAEEFIASLATQQAA